MEIHSTGSTGNAPAYWLTSQESPRDTPQSVAGSAAPAPKSSDPALQGLSTIKNKTLAPEPEQVDTRFSGSDWRNKAFEAQRKDISMQPGTSNSPYLTALDTLQQRDFKPAPGGLEIPFTPNSLLGGGKRTSQLGSSSQNVVVTDNALKELQEAIDDKNFLIDELRQDLETETDAAQRQLTIRALNNAISDLSSYKTQYETARNARSRINN
ncbi:XopO/AvrRps4 family type III secretion system effector [Xylophilus ampelinus]|uniref:XopO/AvrRps4 family type III secretion system effector n=1 Tax=Xylophilus ampelinus TaxID=54067 RepID=UPI0011B599A6|nr:XopO/AvrRps4 family type III secretion system effector [Xylophilus ampelinus]MCS4509501.1 hypothetical protein [Xylophilus ampelinus]